MTADATKTERELIKLIALNDELAFRQLFDRYWNKIYAAAFALTKFPAVSEEIVQDVFVKIWLKRNELSSIEDFEAYLFVVARNHIYNTLRKKIVEQPFVKNLEQYFLENASLPEQPLLVKETEALVARALEQLPAQQRKVYNLSRNEGLDYNTIALQLGISRSTVKNHMTKALSFMRQYLIAHRGEELLLLLLFKLLD